MCDVDGRRSELVTTFLRSARGHQPKGAAVLWRRHSLKSVRHCGAFLEWCRCVVLGKSCRQSKDADSKFPSEKDVKGNLQPTIYMYE